MSKELAFVLINPRTIAKSRTGGVIARYLGRTGLDFVGARMFGPSAELTRRYAECIRNADPSNKTTCDMLADYVEKEYAPDADGRPQRVLMMLFEGVDAVAKVWQVTGSATLRTGSGETIRDTYGDYILNDDGSVRHFEPAVLIGPNKARVAASLKLWAEYASRDGGLIDEAGDVSRGEASERTLVLLKPDNFRWRSSRPGNIVDILSLSGLRIIGAKKFSMTVGQAEAFYGPVREALREKLKDTVGERGVAALGREFGFAIPDRMKTVVGDELGPIAGDYEFENIVQFMTGHRPSECKQKLKDSISGEACLALVYSGPDAVSKIRELLGPTDPSKAKDGSVRREYGSNIMVNAAHASDSPENAERELGIVDVEKDATADTVNLYYGDFFSKLPSLGAISHASSKLVDRIKHRMGTPT